MSTLHTAQTKTQKCISKYIIHYYYKQKNVHIKLFIHSPGIFEFFKFYCRNQKIKY